MKTSQRSPLVKHLCREVSLIKRLQMLRADETVRLAANLQKFRLFDDTSGENIVH